MTASNLDRYKKDLESLIARGEQLLHSIQAECHPEEFHAAAKKKLGKGAKAFIAGLPSFDATYQAWYSEAITLVEQLLPNRVTDFVRHYERPKSRKYITRETYRIEDKLLGMSAAYAGPADGIPHFQQQLGILKAVRARFESSLFDIRQLVMADLFDSELDAAAELARNRFIRAAGAVAGVVLEKHMIEVCNSHGVSLGTKKATIGSLNDSLRSASVVDIAQWRFIQHLGDIRNICDHSKGAEPTPEQVRDLITGVNKTVKTLF